MALTGLDIFKVTPKTNCKDCGNPTCMAFAMKVAQGALPLEKCPHLSEEVKAQLGEATAPPMKTIAIGAGENEYKLGGETVLYRHEKTFVSKSLFAVSVCSCCDDAEKKLEAIKAVDYDRIGERMFVEQVLVDFGGEKAKYIDLVKKAAALGRGVIISCEDPAVAREAAEAIKETKPVVLGARLETAEAYNEIALAFGVVIGVGGRDLNELYDAVQKFESLGNKKLILDVGSDSIKQAYSSAVQIRRAALKNNDRVFGYPSIVRVDELADGDMNLEAALASVFTLKYGSIIVMSSMNYKDALPLFGLRQNIFTDPQKPMKVEPGIYKINGATEDSACALTVDFALTYFVVSGEIERSGVPVNFLISDAGGYSVLTAWAAGKLSASSIAKFFEEHDIAGKIKSRKLIIPGKVAVLKGEIQEKLPGWEIIVAPNEAIQLVKFLKDYK